MTNFEKTKAALCAAINSMTEETLLEFISDYENDSEPYFPSEILFTCQKCRNMYGHCGGSVEYQVCQSRFHEYCKIDE